MLSLTDTFYFDLKLMDSEMHREYTGQGNDQILSNARFLAEKGADILFRQPLIPGVNSPEENVKARAAFIRSLGREDLALQLIPYHRMGTSKYAALDIPYTLEDMKDDHFHDSLESWVEALKPQYNIANFNLD